MEKKITIRIPVGLHALVAEAAHEDTRSLNGEIIHLLRLALERRSV